MTQAWQEALFDVDDAPDHSNGVPRINLDAFNTATDHRLDAHSWITHVPGLLVGHHRLLSLLEAEASWEQRSRWMFDRKVAEPRLTAEYRDLNYAPSLLVELAAVLSAHLDVPYDRVWLNWYRDHNDGTGWHADRPANRAETAAVPVLSVGAVRRFLIRPVGGGHSVTFTPAGGDLLIMRGRCQRDWQHSVPKQVHAVGARMSLNFSSVTQS